MADYVSTADFDALVDAQVRLELFDDSNAGDGSGYDSALFTRASELASSLAQAAAENAGYSPGATSTIDAVKTLALSGLVQLAFGRKSRAVPEATANVLAGLLEGVRGGDVPLPGLTPSSADGVGGVDSTNRSATSSSGTPPRFKSLHLVR